MSDPFNQITIKLRERSFTVSCCFEVMARVELMTGSGANLLGRRMLEANGVKITEIALAVSAILEGQEPRAPDYMTIGAILYEDGYQDLLSPLGMFLVRGLRGNKEHERDAIEAAAARKKAEEEAAARGDAADKPDPQLG